MRFIGDFHIHSKHSRAVSKQMTIPMLDRWADDKGILVMGTGDFTHPLWIKHLKETLEPAEPGLFRVKKQYQEKTIKGTIGQTRFILSVEISSIYSRDGRTRRVHNIILAPDVKTIESINATLLKAGAKLSSDGRPIVGLDAREVAKIAFTANPEAVVIPAHIWTPWFALFGSMSGFNTIEECFGEYSKQIFATSRASSPTIGRPSELNLAPAFKSVALIDSIVLTSGARIILCTRRVRPSLL
jgi:PHP family Zn ribbon phosphoesterase